MKNALVTGGSGEIGAAISRRLARSGDCYHQSVKPCSCARSSMDRALPSEGKGYWFEPSRAHHLRV